MDFAKSKAVSLSIAGLTIAALAGCNSFNTAKPSSADLAAVESTTNRLAQKGSDSVIPVIDGSQDRGLLCVVPLRQGLTFRELVETTPPVKAVYKDRKIWIARPGEACDQVIPISPDSPETLDTILIARDRIYMADNHLISDADVGLGKINAPFERLFTFPWK
jgi:hypothetical protein